MNLNIDLDTATNALEIFNIITDQFGAKALDKDQANNELKKIFDQYAKHIFNHKLNVNGACPYKIISWLSYTLAENEFANNKKLAMIYIEVGISMMRKMLKEAGKELNADSEKKLISMVNAELENNHHVGIGKNGLYTAFRTLAYNNNFTIQKLHQTFDELNSKLIKYRAKYGDI